MAREQFIEWKPGPDTLAVVNQAVTIAAQYLADGYDLTLRQIYYQFVARDLLPNNQRSYKRLGDIINNARLAGLMDWRYLVDRTRNLERNSHWDDPSDIIDASMRSYANDLWQTQPKRVEVWVEKEALAGVVKRAADALDCAWFACRGYVSQSEMYVAAKRFQRYDAIGQEVIVLHLGDHDPSGIDMTRDIRERVALMSYGANVTVDRIALNMDQVEEYGPPPNPAKLADSRAEGYVERFGDDSWELDALDPATLDALIREHIERHLDREAYEEAEATQERGRDQLTTVARRWDEVTDWIENEPEID